MFTPAQCLVIAVALKNVALVLGVVAMIGLAVVLAEVCESSEIGRDIDDERGGES